MDSRTNLVVALIVGVAAGAIGPRMTAPKSRAAREAFTYVPPDGFVESSEGEGTLRHAVVGGQRLWMHAPLAAPEGAEAYTPNVSLTHIAKDAPQTELDLTVLARGMPGMFASTGTSWTELRHAVHLRPDGARVAVLEGGARKSDGSGEPYRVLQMAFPEDTGMSLVTASFPEADAARWEKDFDATLDTARGVKLEAPEPADWTYGAWGLGGAVIAWLGLWLVSRG